MGNLRTHSLTTILGVIKPTGVSQPGGSGCGPAASAIAYDANGNVASRSDFNGNLTTYSYDLSRNLETARTEGSGTSAARTISTQWHAAYRLPLAMAEPLRRTTFAYDAAGNLLTRTEQATTDANGSLGFAAPTTGSPRTWTWTYNVAGQVLTADGPRTDVSDLTTFTYHPANDPVPGRRGQLATITNALGHLTQITAYDANGRPLSLVDPNGVLTTLTYHPRGWLKTRTVAGQTTTFDYRPWGALEKVTYADGSWTAYAYDAAHRLTGRSDSGGMQVAYTLDAAGHRLQETWLNPDGSTARQIHRSVDALGRLKDEVEGLPTNPLRAFGYFAGGEPKFETTPKGDTTQFEIDALGRTTKRIDPVNGAAAPLVLAWDGLDRLKQLTAPNGAVTAFTVSGLGDLTGESSADAGNTSATYDAAGHLKTRTDARGIVRTYSYDALDRLVLVSTASGQNRSFIWDSAPGCGLGVGRLCRIVDPAGSTTFSYDARGNRISATRSEDGLSFVTVFSHDAADRPADLITPTAEVLVPTRDAGGRIAALAATQGATTTPVAQAITYAATGTIRSQTLGQATVVSQTLDAAGRPDVTESTPPAPPPTAGDGDVPLPAWALALLGAALFGALHRRRGVAAGLMVIGFGIGLLGVPGALPSAHAADLDYGYDANGNVTSRVSPSGTTTYTYDPLDRIDLEAGPAGSRNHDFDAGENRVSDGAGTTVSVAPGSNRLATINGVAVTLDAAGNLLADGSFLYAWDDWGNLSSLRRADGTLLATYFYDSRHLRTRKETTAAAPQGAGKTYYHYDQAGRLIAETAPGNVPVATYVWNDDVLTGYIRYVPARTVYTVQTDPLGSPFQVRRQDGTVVWRWESEAFGKTAPNEDVDGDGQKLILNLRFPGQYFDVESGLHYNWHRYYSPRLGRYISSDPIGLAGGLNGYTYANNAPTMFTDPLGLQAIPSPPPPIPGFPMPGRPSKATESDPLDPGQSKPGWKWPSLSWPDWLTPKNALDRCEEKCDAQYDNDQKLCETWWKTSGRNPDAYRVCMNNAREDYIKCYQDCKKDCSK